MASTSTEPPPAAATPLIAENVEAEMTAHVSGITPQLQNVVATVNLGTKLDLKEIAMNARNAEYNPKVCMVESCPCDRVSSSGQKP